MQLLSGGPRLHMSPVAGLPLIHVEKPLHHGTATALLSVAVKGSPTAVFDPKIGICPIPGMSTVRLGSRSGRYTGRRRWCRNSVPRQSRYPASRASRVSTRDQPFSDRASAFWEHQGRLPARKQVRCSQISRHKERFLNRCLGLSGARQKKLFTYCRGLVSMSWMR